MSGQPSAPAARLEPSLHSSVCHFLFAAGELARDTAEFGDLVDRQDRAFGEAVPQGISARVHQRGYYAPMEDLNPDIRRYVLQRMGAAAGAA